MPTKPHERALRRAQKAGERRELTENVVKLHSLGWSFRAIESQLGIPRNSAHRLWTEHRKELDERGFEERRRDEFERVTKSLDLLSTRAFEHALGTTNANPGAQIAAITAAVRIIESKRSVFGLDQPQKLEVSAPAVEPQIENFVAHFDENGMLSYMRYSNMVKRVLGRGRGDQANLSPDEVARLETAAPGVRDAFLAAVEATRIRVVPKNYEALSQKVEIDS